MAVGDRLQKGEEGAEGNRTGDSTGEDEREAVGICVAFGD